jgi:PilZ domain
MLGRYWPVMEPLEPASPMPEAGRRSHSRLRVRLPARLTMLDGSSSAILTDLSLGGAKLQTRFPIVPGEQAMLFWHDFEAFGTITWTYDGMCGMRFDELLAPRVLIATRDLHDADHLPHDRDLVRDVAREWVSGVRR